MVHDGERQGGQASVELVALLPLLAVIGGVLWQAAVAGEAVWLAGAAARAAARAAAVGGDAAAAARGTLPARLEPGLRVSSAGDRGAVRVAVRIPSVLTGGSLATVSGTAAFPDQGS
jgi:hypothetical protein